MAELTQYEMTTGIIIMIVMILELLLAVMLLVKYVSTKDRRIIYFALFMTFGAFSFIAITLNFVTILVTGNSIDLLLYLLLAFGFAPLSLIFWMILITELMYQDKRKIILGLFLIYWIAFRIAFFYILFTDMDSLVTNYWIGGLQVGIFLRVTMATQLIVILVTSILFFRESHKSENKEVRLKGTLFLLGILILVGSMLMFSITLNSIFVLIFMIPTILLFWGSLAMPEWVKKNLIKERD